MCFKRILITLVLSAVIASCANTSLLDSWHNEEIKNTYNHLLVIGVTDSQQTRQLYEKHFVSELQKRNISATPSFQLITSKQEINRDTVVAALEDTEIDAVLVTYLVSAESKVKHRESPLNVGYSGSVESTQISETIVSNRGQSRDEEIFVLKNDIYSRQAKALVWSARTKTVGPESIDQVVLETTSLLIKEMVNDAVIK